MAFNTNTAAVQSNAQNDNWKAQGFLNLYLPSKDGKGGRRKLGAIPLKDAKPAEKQLMDWLNEDPSRVSVIMSKLVIEYQSADGGNTAGFDI
jgi:hypothetical protein